MTYEEILRELRSGKFHPIYFLHGEEPFFIDRIEKEIQALALTEAERGFNESVLYGKDVDAITLLDYLRRYPMMCERQVVILREAQEMKGIGDLLAYIEQPMPTTVFVLCFKHKKYDMNTKFGKALKAKCMVFESKRLYDNQLPDWIAGYAKSQKLSMEPAAINMLAEYLGAELDKVANEIDKLALNLKKGAAVTAAQVQEFVGISKDYNVFELQKAIAMRDVAKVMRIEQYFSSNIRKNPFIVTISSLHSFFTKVYMLHFLKGKPEAEMVKTLGLRSEWFLKDYKLGLSNFNLDQTCRILSLLHTYDLRSKGVDNDNTSTGEEALMRELFFRILHEG